MSSEGRGSSDVPAAANVSRTTRAHPIATSEYDSADAAAAPVMPKRGMSKRLAAMLQKACCREDNKRA